MAVRAGHARELAERSVVSVWNDDGGYLGTGFFLAEGVVVTCAHVVQSVPDAVRVEWSGRRIAARVAVRAPAERGDGEFYAFPDLALLRLAEPLDHPVAQLADPPVAVPRRLVAHGFSKHTPDPGVGPETAELRTGGRSGHRHLKVTGDEIPDGMSGGPAVDEETGWVFGVVKGSRDYHAPRGGWLIRTAEIHDLYTAHPELSRGALPPTPLVRPDPGTPLFHLLTAQRQAADRLPYRLDDRPPPPLSSVYVRQRTSRRGTEPASDADLFTITDVLRWHRHALVVGGPGTGKSTLVAHLVADAAAWWLAAEPGPATSRPPAGPVVPVRIAATELLRGDRPFHDAIAAALNADLAQHLDQPVTPELFHAPPAPGADWMFLVDGVDEVLDVERRERLLTVLHDRLAEFGTSARFLVTSRDLVEREFGALSAGVVARMRDRFGEYTLTPFDADGLAEFAAGWFAARDPAHADRLTAGYLAEVDRNGIFPLVRVPLLATIAAIVYERNPDQPMPADRTGLYREFLERLLYQRRARLRVRAELRERMAAFGAAAEEFADWLFDNTEPCLEYLAHRWIAGDTRPTEQDAADWVTSRRAPPDGVPVARVVRDLLLATGVLVVRGDALAFSHQSLAEYLAAGHAARTFDQTEWLLTAYRLGTTSRGMFALARWVEAGHDPVPLLTELLRAGRRLPMPLGRLDRTASRRGVLPASTEPPWRLAAVDRLLRSGHLDAPAGLATYCALLEDGVRPPPSAAAELALRADRCVRRAWDVTESTAPLLRRILRALRTRGGGAEHLAALLADRRVSAVKRVEAARVLIEDTGSTAAMDALLEMAHRPRPAGHGQLWALRTLVAVADRREGEFAALRLRQIARTDDRPAVWNRAAVLLVDLGREQERDHDGSARAARADGSEVDGWTAMADALLTRATDRDRDVSRRSAAFDTLGVAGGVALPRYDPDAHPGRRGPWDDTDSEPRSRLAQQTGEGIGRVGRVAPEVAGRAARTVMTDRGFGWLERVDIAHGLATEGRPDLAADALLRLAADPRLDPHARAFTLWQFGRYQPDQARDTLRSWATDPAGDPARRVAALSALSMLDRAGAAALAASLVADPTLPLDARTTAAWTLGPAAVRLLWAGCTADPGRPRLMRLVARLYRPLVRTATGKGGDDRGLHQDRRRAGR